MKKLLILLLIFMVTGEYAENTKTVLILRGKDQPYSYVICPVNDCPILNKIKKTDYTIYLLFIIPIILIIVVLKFITNNLGGEKWIRP